MYVQRLYVAQGAEQARLCRERVKKLKIKKNYNIPEINKQREITALNRQGTQRQRPELPTVTPPGVLVNTRYTNSTKGTSSDKVAPSGMYTLHSRHTRRHRCVQVVVSFLLYFAQYTIPADIHVNCFTVDCFTLVVSLPKPGMKIRRHRQLSPSPWTCRNRSFQRVPN